MSTVQLSMPTAVYAEAATEAPVSQETQPAVQTETQPAAQPTAQPETQPADQEETQAAAKTETQPAAQPETQPAAQPEAAQPASQAASQKEEQAAAPGSSETAPKAEKETEERETAYEVSKAAKKFVSDVSTLNWDSIKALRKTQFEADASSVHHPEDAALKNAASNADQAMKQSRDSLAALQRAYSALSREDQADQSVKEADQKLETVVTNLSNYEKSYFTDKVNALDSAEVLRISQAAVNAKAALDANEDEAKKEAFEKAFNDADYAHKQSQADLDSLLNIYNQFSDEQKADAKVAAAYEALTSLNSQAAAITEPEASESPAETETEEPQTEGTETDESVADTSAPAAASAKLAGARRAPAVKTNEASTPIIGTIKGQDALANDILFSAVNDTDFFQFTVTVKKENGKTELYTTSRSSEDCHASVDFDYNFTITGIQLDATDKVKVKCIPNPSISSYSFESTESDATLKDGKGQVDTPLELSIAKDDVQIRDVVIGDTGTTSYNGSWSIADKQGHTYGSNISFRGTDKLTLPQGAAFTVNASRDGYILSTLSTASIKRTDNNTSAGSVQNTTLNSALTYDFVWVKKASDEESSFTKTWLDDGTDTETHEKTPSLVTLQYQVAGDDGEWKDVSESDLLVPSGSITQTSKANSNKSIYTLSYSGLPEYMAVKNSDGTSYTQKKISYRLEEKEVPSGYSKESDGQNLVNTKEYTLNATIRWQDSDNSEGARPNTDELSPDSIKKLIQIYNGESDQLVSVDQGNIQVTDQKDGTYTITIHGLPSYAGTMDNPNTYYIKKFDIPDKTAADGKNLHYTTLISNKSGVHENSEDAWNGATITFTISKTIDFSEKKVWEDVFPSLRPKTMLELYRYTTNPQNMELVSVRETPDKGVRPETDLLSYKDLDAYDNNGRQYHYVLKEVIPASDDGNYEAIYKDASGNETTLGCPNGGTVLNKNVKNTTSISVQKHWVAKGTTLKVAGYTVHVGLKRYTKDPDQAVIVKDNTGKPLVQKIDGFADYNDLTAGTTFSDLPMIDEKGEFYTYVPYEMPEQNYISAGDEDGTLDVNDAFTIRDASGEIDTYRVTEVTPANCESPTKKTRVAEITNTLGGTIRFVLSKKWLAKPGKTSVQYAIHRVDPYGKEEVLDHEGKWVALADAKETYTGELTGAADKTDWGSTYTDIVLPLYDENSSRYTYFVDEVNDNSRHYFDYTLTQDDTGRADLVESVAITNNNVNGDGDGQNMDVDLYKTWVDGGDTSTRRPVVIKVFRVDQGGKVDRPTEWDDQGIGVYTLSADNGWHVTNLFGFSGEQLTTYFGSEKNGVRTLTDENGNTRTFDNLLKNNIVYREVKVGDTDVPAGDSCSYDSYTTTLSAGNDIKVTQKYKVTYTGNNDSEVKNVKQGSVVYEINSKWYDGHYLKGRPDVTFNITRDGDPYAICVVTAGDDGKVSTKVTIDGKDAVEGKDYTFALGQGDSLNDYTLTFNNFPLYNEDAGTRYGYACTESLPEGSGYINNSQLDPGFPRTTTGADGENNENLKITTSFRNRRVDQSEKISYTKIWEDHNNSENIRPDVTLNLAARVKSASQIEAAGGDEEKLDLIPISGDTYMEAVSGQENTYRYTFAQSMPKYVTKDLVNASNDALTDDDIGAEVTYYASETMTGDGAERYKEKDTPAEGTTAIQSGDKTYLANGSIFTNTMFGTMEASGTKVFSNVPYDMESDPLVMPQDGSIIFTLTQKSEKDTGNGSTYTVNGKPATAKLVVKNGSYTFAFKDDQGHTLKIPKYDDNGNPYIYSVTESFSDDKAVAFNQVFQLTHVSRDLEVTNRYIAGRRSITVTKEFETSGWTDDEIKEGRYPDVEFTLYRVKPGATFNENDSSQKLQTKTIPGTDFKNNNGNVTFAFNNLYDLTPSGQRFAYYVVEKPINGYTVSCSVNKGDWNQTDTAAMQSDDGSKIYDEVSFKNDYQKDNLITISANKKWSPEGILSSLSDVNNSDLTFSLDGLVNNESNHAGNVKYAQGKDFSVKWDNAQGDSAFTIMDKDGNSPLELRRYTSLGEAYVYRITEDTTTDVWKAGGKLQNFNCATDGHFAQKWSTDTSSSQSNPLNLGTIENVYGRTSLVVTKQWDDNSNKNDMRPRSITVKLQYSTDGSNWTDVNADFLHRNSYDVSCDINRGSLSDGVDLNGVTYQLKEKVKDENRAWTNCLTFRNLPLYENGKQYQYRAVETAIGGDAIDDNVAASYQCINSTNTFNEGSNVFISTLRNKLLPASVTVTKTWADDSDKFLARPESLTLYLQRKVGKGNWEYVRHSSDNSLYTVVISSANNWSYAEQDTLPKEDTQSNTYTYRFTEKAEGAAGTENDDSVNDVYSVNDVTVTAQNGNISYTGSEKTTDTGLNATKTDITNTLDTTSLTVEKKWASEDGKTPVTFQIQYQDKTTGSSWTAFKGVTLTLNEANTWKASLTNLPKRGKDGSDRYYRAVELDKNGNTVNFTDNGTTISSKDGADGVRDFDLGTGMFRSVYTLEVGENGTTETVTNIKRTTVNVTKTFRDGANREVYRPASLTIACVSDNEDANKHTRTGNVTATASTKTVSSTTDLYTYSFIVDQYDRDGKKLDYKITETFSGNNQGQYQETDVLSKSADTEVTVLLHTDTVDAQEADTAAVTNQHDISVFDLTLNKTWNDFYNFYNERPDKITVTLQYSTDGSRWNTVKNPETNVTDKDYATAYATDVTAGYSTDVAAKTLKVDANGSVNAADATWHNLPVYARVGGQRVALQYRVLESKVTDYNNDGTKATSAVTGTDEKGAVKNSTVSLENTLNTTSVTVTKKWMDDNNFNGQRQSIEVQLYQNGTAIKDDVLYQGKALIELKTSGTTAETSAYTFQNLPRQDAQGRNYTYTVDEVNVPSGYTKSVSGTTITNRLTPVTASVSVTKDFGQNDWTKKAPKGFSFSLTRGSNDTQKVTTPMPAGTNGNTATVTINKDTKDLTAAFAAISYDHIGEYHYTLTENNGGVDGVAYDWDDSNNKQRTHNVTVIVSRKSDNTLADSVEYDGKDSLTVKNAFYGTSASISVTKDFGQNDWAKKAPNGFTFTLTAKTNTAGVTTPMPEGAAGGVVSKTATASQHTVDFGSIRYEKTGTYTYTVQETAGDEDGITYDTTPYKVEVVITKAADASNKLRAAVKYYGKDGKELTDGLTVTNTFTPVSGELKVRKEFNDWSKAGSFTFDLTPVENAPMPADAKAGKKSVTVNDGSAAGFGSMTFEKAGTYTYHIREEKGTASGVQYDTQEHTAVVKVEKGTANKLSVTEITYDGKKADKLTDPLVITNTFTPVQSNVAVTKEFNGWTDKAYGDYFANTKFTFNISAVTAGAPLPEENGKNVLTAEAGKTVPTATFKPITFVKEGTYTYNIKEDNDHKDGILYDGNTHTVTIVVSKDNDNKLTVSSIKYDDTNNSATNDDTHNSLTITNTYTPAVTADPIQVTKNFSDWTRTEKGFTFTLTAGSNTAGNGEDGKAIATPMPAGTNGTSMTVDAVSDEKATAVFGKITYRKAGIYHYILTEANGEEDGITYDTADGDSTKAKEHQVQVKVEKDSATNALTAEVTYDGQTSLTITNTVASETAHIQAKKDFNDWNKSASEFTFTLKADNYCKPGETEPSDKVTVPMPEGAKDGAVSGKATSAAPNVDFGAITYKKAGTYHYTITETNDGRDGVSYDAREHTVTVTVSKASDRTNKLSASVKYDGNQDSLTISNTFTAVKASIGLTKQFLNKDTKENWPVDTSFTFDLKADSNTAGVAKNPMPEVTAVTATKDQPTVSFGNIAFCKAGTYYYTVTERNGQVDGVSYDAAPYTVAAVVSKDSNNNALTANIYYDVTKNDKGTVPQDAKTSLTISNTYTPLKQTLQVTKAFNGWNDWNLFDDDKFTFTLTPETAGAPMPSGENSGKATVSKESPEAVFGEITYTKAGTYEYQITETNDHLDGVSYDTTAHNVLVSVSKSTDATNALSAVVKYDGKTSLTITNTFTPVHQSLSVSKNFNDWTKAHSFTFNLSAKDQAPMPNDQKGATVSVRKDSTADKTTGYPSAAFGQIEFDRAGTYVYTITEENGGADGVDYDTDGSKKPTQHEVKVTIAKDKDTNELSVASVDSLTVRNTYTPATAHVEVTKDFNDWSKADSFTFDIAAAGNTAKDIDGNEVKNPMPKNPDGKEVTSQSVDQDQLTAVFDDMTFKYAGVYTYTITERNDHRDGVSYDVNPHTVTVTVTKSDDAVNALSAVVTYEAANDSDIVPEDKSSLTIKNTFTPVSIAADDLSKNFNGWTDSKKYGNFFDDVTFDLVLKPVTKDAPMPEGSDKEAVVTATKKNPAPDFREMTYVKAGTYEYTIQEVNGGVDGVDYDTDGTGKPTVHKVVVTVTKADDATNALSAAISYDGKDQLEIKNTFTPVDPPLHVTKSFNDWSNADSFTFNIKALTEGAPMPVNLTATATEAEKTAEFRNIEFWEVGKGTYEYEISEVNDGIDGIAYDTNAHKVVIQVTKADDATNALSAAVLYDGVEEAKDDSTGLTIRNTFTAATAVLKVTKDFNDWSKASSFRFDLKAKGNAPMPESQNGDVAEATKKNTTVAFGEIAFDKAGTYRYIITEENTGVDNVTYDTAKHKVEVTVVKDENTNALTVESVKYDGDSSLTIRNTYTAPAAGKSVKTGDTTPLNGWTAMLLAAMCLGFVAMEERRRQKKNHN
ncbi:Spy0128 family protein [Porcincola intestinalis]|nr:FctA domain-containing protein [Porcincola intestinalis]